MICKASNSGAAGRIRTHDPLVRSQVLYPTELQPPEALKYNTEILANFAEFQLHSRNFLSFLFFASTTEQLRCEAESITDSHPHSSRYEKNLSSRNLTRCVDTDVPRLKGFGADQSRYRLGSGPCRSTSDAMVQKFPTPVTGLYSFGVLPLTICVDFRNARGELSTRPHIERTTTL